jgi:hypothetical protein
VSASAAERILVIVSAETQVEDPTEHPTKLDSHANNCIARKSALIVRLSDKKVNVTGFDPLKCEVANLDLVSAALACNCPATAEGIMLMVHQAIHVPTMENDLLCPMQMRMNHTKVQDCPKFVEE